MAREYESRLPVAFRFLRRGLGTRETCSGGTLSLVMFRTDYLRRLFDLGEADAAVCASDLAALVRAA